MAACFVMQRSCVPGVTGTGYVFDVYDPLNLLVNRYLARGTQASRRKRLPKKTILLGLSASQ